MGKGSTFSAWKLAVAMALAGALLFQALLSPLSKIRAIEAAALEQALSVICSDDGPSADGAHRKNTVHCEQDCCLRSQRLDIALDLPAFLDVVLELLPSVRQAAPETPRDRPPPQLFQIASGSLGSRAPPHFS